MTLAPEKIDVKVQLRLADGWFTVCDLALLIPGRGVAALLPTATRPRCSSTARASCTPSTTATPSAAPPSSPGASPAATGAAPSWPPRS